MVIEKKKLSELKPAPYNPRKSTEEQERHLSQSLTKFGVVEPIIFNKQTEHIVGGHFRVRELKKLGYKEVGMLCTFPLDYDYLDINPVSIMGRSVLPVMMANISNQIYLQWLK